ncbi:hypothetical protein DIPPA_32818 [Diplonema papillatum]|nr:hypothetical protein DIPPA_32818 [Diplonema papillatum]
MHAARNAGLLACCLGLAAAGGREALPFSASPGPDRVIAPAPADQAKASPSQASSVLLSSALTDTQKGHTAKAIGFAASAAFFSGGSAAVTLAALRNSGCETENDDTEELAWVFHPTRVGFGDGPKRYLLGAMLLNPAVAAGCALLLFAAAGAVCAARRVPWSEALAAVHGPGLMWGPVSLLAPGTAMAAAKAIFSPSTSPGVVALAWAVLPVCVSVPGLIWWFVLRSARNRCSYVHDPYLPEEGDVFLRDTARVAKLPENFKRAYRFLLGDSLWTSDGESGFVERAGGFFDSLRPGRIGFPIAELVIAEWIAVLSVWKVDSSWECNARNTLVTAALLGQFVAGVALRPYTSAFQNVAFSAVAGGLFLVSLLVTTVIWKRDGQALLDFLSVCIILTAILALLRSLWLIFAHLIEALLPRRDEAYRVIRERADLCDLCAKSDDSDKTDRAQTAASFPFVNASCLSQDTFLTENEDRGAETRSSPLLDRERANQKRTAFSVHLSGTLLDNKQRSSLDTSLRAASSGRGGPPTDFAPWSSSGEPQPDNFSLLLPVTGALPDAAKQRLALDSSIRVGGSRDATGNGGEPQSDSNPLLLPTASASLLETVKRRSSLNSANLRSREYRKDITPRPGDTESLSLMLPVVSPPPPALPSIPRRDRSVSQRSASYRYVASDPPRRESLPPRRGDTLARGTPPPVLSPIVIGNKPFSPNIIV